MINLKSMSLLFVLGLITTISCQQQEDNATLSSAESTEAPAIEEPARDSVTSKAINDLTYFIPRERTADLIVFNYGFGSGVFGGLAYPAIPRALAEAGFAVVLNAASGVDQFGGGPKTVASIVAKAEAVFDDASHNLTLTDKIGVIGHSMGGGPRAGLYQTLPKMETMELTRASLTG